MSQYIFVSAVKQWIVQCAALGFLCQWDGYRGHLYLSTSWSDTVIMIRAQTFAEVSALGSLWMDTGSGTPVRMVDV